MPRPSFVLHKTGNRQFHFNLLGESGETILTSRHYTTKNACFSGIDSVKRNAVQSIRYRKRVALNGLHYYNLKAENGRIIGRSEQYRSETSRNKSMASVIANAPIAAIEDRT